MADVSKGRTASSFIIAKSRKKQRNLVSERALPSNSSFLLDVIFYPEDGGSAVLQNVREILLDNTALDVTI
jgi:hypothetical protein